MANPIAPGVYDYHEVGADDPIDIIESALQEAAVERVESEVKRLRGIYIAKKRELGIE